MPQLTAGTIGLEVLGRNSGRKAIFFLNGNTSGDLYLDNTSKESIQTTTAGIRLTPGQCIVMSAGRGRVEQITNFWAVKATEEAVKLLYFEFFGDSIEEGETLNIIFSGGSNVSKLNDRSELEATVLDAEVIPPSGTATHIALDCTALALKTIHMSTNFSVNFDFQASDDGITWYDITDAAGTALTVNVNNARKAYGLNDYCKYLRIFARNQDATNSATVTVKVLGVV